MRSEITKRAEFAVRAPVALAEQAAADSPDRGVAAVQPATRFATTPAFSAQVVTPLVRAGWVHSDPVPTGGYRLAVPLHTVSVLDVIERIDGRTDDGYCVVDGGPCRADVPRLLHRGWKIARCELACVLDGIPVRSLLGHPIAPPELMH